MNRSPFGVAVAVAFAPVVFAPAFLSSACSSTGGLVAAIADAGASSEASTSDPGESDGDANGDVAPACKKKPDVSLAFHVQALARDGKVSYLGGATVTFTSCDPFELTTTAGGTATAMVTRDLPFSPKISSPAYLDTYFARLSPKDDLRDVTDVSVALFAKADVDLLPAYDPHEALLALVLEHAPDTSNCNTFDGVTLTVQDRPEAVVHYMSPSWPTDKAESNGTSPWGPYVFVTGLHGGSPVVVDGKKTGCWVRTQDGGQTGYYDLFDGAVTVANIEVEPED